MDIDVERSIDSRPVCRLCLGEEDILEQLGDLHRWISDYLSIVIHPNDHLSHSICVYCRARLEEFRDYQQRCVEIQNVQRSQSSRIVCDEDTTFTLNQLDKVEAIKKEPGSLDNSQQICRLCLSRECVDDVFSYGDLDRWISDYLSIEISNEDSTNRFCCAICKIRLEEFRNFHLRCLEVQTRLQNSEVTVVKVEPAENTAEDFESSPIVEETDGEQSIQCKVCHKVIKGTKRLKDKLTNHMVMHGPKKYACSICEKAFARSFHLKDHMKVHNKIDKGPVECGVCHKMFKNMSTLRVHNKYHGPKKHVCHICGIAFAVRQSLRNHLQTHNSIETIERHSDHPLRCDICFKLLKNQISLRYHKKNHEPKSQVCSICSAAFIRGRRLSVHMGTHKKRSLQSEEMDEADMDKLLSGDPYECELCPKMYHFQHDLLRHMRNVHKFKKHTTLGLENDQRSPLDKRKSDDVVDAAYPFKCTVCRKVYKKKALLVKHIKKIRAKMAFKCTVCNERFYSRDLLERHFKDAIHAENSTHDTGNNAESSMDSNDMFEAEEIKVEIQSDDDD